MSFISKSMFFDRSIVLDKTERAMRRVLSRMGAFIRTRARSSIRQRKSAADPGSPPSSHTGILRRFIFFGWDPSARSVVVGPVPVNQVAFNERQEAEPGLVPSILEFGGKEKIFEVLKYGRWQRYDLRMTRRNYGLPTRWRDASYRPRPFMQPAMEAELKKFDGLLRNCVSGGPKTAAA